VLNTKGRAFRRLTTILNDLWAALVNPKFQGGFQKIPIIINDLRQFPAPASGYILVNCGASACSASASVTWPNVVSLARAEGDILPEWPRRPAPSARAEVINFHLTGKEELEE